MFGIEFDVQRSTPSIFDQTESEDINLDTHIMPASFSKWEMELADIAKGKSSKEKFLKDIESEIQEAVLKYRK